jgi:hypothetical protein
VASQLAIARAIQDAATKSGQPVTGDLQQLAQLISQLPAASQAAYITSIQQGISTGQVGQLSQAVIDQMTQQVQPQVQAALAASQQQAGQPQTNAQAPAATPQAAQLTGATLTEPNLPSAATAAPAASTGGETVSAGSAASSGGTGTSAGANTPSVTDTTGTTAGYLQTYTQDTDQSGYTMPPGSSQAQQLAYLAGYLGVSPSQVQSEYAAYVAGTQTSGPARAQGGQAGYMSTPGATVTALPIDQWVASQVNNIEGTYAPILNAYEQAYEQTADAPMPPELRQSLRQELQNMPPAQQQALNGVLYNYLLAWNTAQQATDPYQKAQEEQAALATVHGNFPLLDTIFNDYESTHISSTAQANYASQQQQAFIQSYVQATGSWPTQDQVDKYGTLPAQEQQQAIDNSNMANLPMTYANYTQTLNLLNSGGGGSGATSWQEAFGTDPTPQQVYDLSHMNATDIRAYIDQSPSKEIPGMNIGTYSNLQQVGSDLSTKLFGSSDSTQLISMFNEANQKS